MKMTAGVVVVLAGLMGGAAWWGLSRHAVAKLTEETNEKVMLAEKLVERGDAPKALATLDELLAKGAKLGEKGRYLRLVALDETGAAEETVTVAASFLQDFPSSEQRTRVEVIRLTAELDRSGLTNPALRTSVEEFVAEHPDHPATARLQIALAHQDLDLGDHRAAQRRLSQAMNHAAAEGEELFAVARALGDANLQRLFSGPAADTDTVVEVQRGDTINGIARKHGVTEELLMRANDISNPRLLRVGQKLRVPAVDFSLHVDISANTMTLNNFGQFFKLYRVRTGREAGSTPTGEFRVLNKKTDPTWRPGNGYTYGPGDPNNELGTRWMAFEGDILGIHGTLHPETVGHYASNGCVGMTTADVEELFDLITVGTPLVIEGKQDLERHKVIPAPQVPPPQEIASR